MTIKIVATKYFKAKYKVEHWNAHYLVFIQIVTSKLMGIGQVKY